MSDETPLQFDETDILKILVDYEIPRDRWTELSAEEKNEILSMVSELAAEGYSDRFSRITSDIWDEPPPDIRTILTDPYYLGGVGGGDLYPLLISDMIDIFTNPEYCEVVLTGAIGWGKSYFAALGMAIEIILLLHLKDPQTFCGVAKKTKISMVNMSTTGENAKSVLYDKVYQFLASCPWIKENHPINDRTGVYFKEKNIEFRPGSSSEMSVIGEDLIGAALDEANFMVGARRSKRAILAGEYDVAKIIYDAIARRRMSRFVSVLSGKVVPPARMWLISSKQFPGDFLEKRIAQIESQRIDGKRVFTKIMDYPQWATKLSLPPDKQPYCGKWFAVFIGDTMHESRIINTAAEHPSAQAAVDSFRTTVPTGCKVLAVPIEYLSYFIEDIYGAIRDFAGVATLASKPFFSDIAAFEDMVCNEEIGDVPRIHPYAEIESSIVAPDMFVADRVLVQYDHEGVSRPFLHPDEPRFAHFDQSITGDDTGFAICHFGGYKDLVIKALERYRDPVGTFCERFVDVIERRPIVICDFMMRINPPVGGRIDLDSLRSLLYAFERLSGIRKFEKITYDQFESESQIAALRKEGYNAERFSVDRNSGACYGYLRSAISDRRFSMYEYAPLIEDLTTIERTPKGKVDHRQGGSKDVSDCVSACCHHIEEKYMTFRLPMIPDAGRDRSSRDRNERFTDDIQSGGNTPTGEREFDPFAVRSLIDRGGIW